MLNIHLATSYVFLCKVGMHACIWVLLVTSKDWEEQEIFSSIFKIMSSPLLASSPFLSNSSSFVLVLTIGMRLFFWLWHPHITISRDSRVLTVWWNLISSLFSTSSVVATTTRMPYLSGDSWTSTATMSPTIPPSTRASAEIDKMHHQKNLA